jgi:hypothetical protein
MIFDAMAYGPEVAAILALDGDGQRLMPLALGRCSSQAAYDRLRASGPARLFMGARAPEAAFAGLYLYFSCLDEAHTTAQEISTAEGSFWHAIMHRQEPDPGNSGYWFQRVGAHPIFPALRESAAETGVDFGPRWDPFAFIDYCERARRDPGSELEARALAVQRMEWQLLFDYCATRKS